VVTIPTNRDLIRKDQTDLIYKTEEAKFIAVSDDIAERYEKGQPVLIGTTSVERSEYLSRMLQKRHIPHSVLNAKFHEQEAGIVAEAGRRGAITVATNMAGRGTDIVLGGNVDYLVDQRLRSRGLDPVETPDEYDSAWHEELPKVKEQVAEEAEHVRDVGGLYVLGTERHESRRIDNQLRGRSGRQGDPGESRFYLSLGDELMRRFNGATLESLLTRLNLPDDVPIEAKMVTRAIKSAQTQVEQQNFEIRKNVLKYDEVMNKQRMVIYDERRRILEGEDLRQESQEMLVDVVRAYVDGATAEGYAEDWDLEQLWGALRTLYPVGVDHHDLIDSDAVGEAGELTREELLDILVSDAEAAYTKREADIDAVAGTGAMRQLERNVLLNVLDRKWREHLYEMDYLKEGIGLRAMAQRDPLVEYQREGYDMFTGMLDAIKEESVGFLFNVQVEGAPQAPTVAAQAMPEGLRARGLDDDESRPLTYVGPSEDGDAEIQRHDTPVTAATGGASRRERRGARRQENKERKLLRRR
jgi:preprotein translocase subunit SecA